MNESNFNKIGDYTFKNTDLLKRALTHSSYANERHIESYERLEFLGDSILGFICAEYLYKSYPSLTEGDLTKIRASVVCEKSLWSLSEKYGFKKLLLLGHGEEVGGGRERKSILADIVESIIAAIYLDGGIDEARKFAMSFIPDYAELAYKEHLFKDYKTTLQEIVQKSHEETLEYKLKNEEGPDHNKVFTVELYINSNLISEGKGKSKKEAEQNAAHSALMLMGEEA